MKWPKIRLPLTLYNKLFQHQRIGVQWMASLYLNEIKGGILADDMGMVSLIAYTVMFNWIGCFRIINNTLSFILPFQGQNYANTSLSRITNES